MMWSVVFVTDGNTVPKTPKSRQIYAAIACVRISGLAALGSKDAAHELRVLAWRIFSATRREELSFVPNGITGCDLLALISPRCGLKLTQEAYLTC